MGDGSARAAVWYAVASCDETIGRWTLRVSMTTDADGGAREDGVPPTIEAACDLLRLWYARVTRTEP